MTADPAELIEAHTLPDPAWADDFERIYLPSRTKTELIEYGRLVHQLAEEGIDRDVLELHGLVLVHGPPGTGKTTVARGAANELARRLQTELAFRHVRIDQLAGGELGQTPKLVAQAFAEIRAAADRGVPVVVLLDEVESLFVDRGQLSGDADPYDSTRAVNTALNEIDRLAEYAQVYTIATSNQRGAIDRAFADRADTELRVGLPTERFRAYILADAFAHWNDALGTDLPTDREALEDLIGVTEGFSGRQIWKAIQGALVHGTDLPEITLGDIARAAASKREALEAAGHVRPLGTDEETDSELPVVEDATRPEPLTFRFATQGQAAAVREAIPAVFCTDRADARYRTIELQPETPTKWVQTAAETATTMPDGTNRTGADHSVGQFSPRTAVVDPQRTGAQGLLADIGDLVSQILAAAGHGDPEAVRTLLGDERVRDAVFELVTLEALETVRVSTDGFTLDIDVHFGTAEAFLEAPPAAIVPQLADQAPVRLTVAAEADGRQAVTRCPRLRSGPATITVTTAEEAS